LNMCKLVHSGERPVLCGSLLDISHENGRSLLCITAASTYCVSQQHQPPRDALMG